MLIIIISLEIYLFAKLIGISIIFLWGQNKEKKWKNRS